MGLGLAIVKNIVENFRGRIWFKTKPGIGTTFFIEIPIFEGE
jgi:signal transduction histidine kinase